MGLFDGRGRAPCPRYARVARTEGPSLQRHPCLAFRDRHHPASISNNTIMVVQIIDSFPVGIIRAIHPKWTVEREAVAGVVGAGDGLVLHFFPSVAASAMRALLSAASPPPLVAW